MTAIAQKTSWADDVDEDLEKPRSTEDFVDEGGIRTIVEYAENEKGKNVKITRRTRQVLLKSVVEHQVAERQKWTKFGKEHGKKPGPDRATTTVAESLTLKLTAGNKAVEPEQSVEATIRANLARKGGGKVVCRMCKGDHFTAKCPYRDSLAGLEQNPDLGLDDDTAPPPTDADAPLAGGVPAPTTGGKYVPPSMRGGVRGPGETMGGRTGGAAGGPGGLRDDLPTLRVTNISEDTQEADLRELFGRFGRVARVYVGRDRETGVGKGFAFVSFEERAVAQRAMEKVHGRGYDNLILSVQWSQPRADGK